MELRLARTWDDRVVPPAEVATVDVSRRDDGFEISVDAPFFGDPPPVGPPGSTPELWQHEVVEVFFLGDDTRYLEVELSPHGHHLVLELHGVRCVTREGLPLRYAASIRAGRWRGRASVPSALVPPGPLRINAFAMHGVAAGRRYLAWRAPGGSQPDFHRLDAFRPFNGDDDPRGRGSPGD